MKTEKLDSVNLKLTRNQVSALDSRSALESNPLNESSLNDAQIGGLSSNKKVGRAIFYSHNENSNKLQTTIETQDENDQLIKNTEEDVKTESKPEYSIYLSKQFENKTEILDLSKQMFDC